MPSALIRWSTPSRPARRSSRSRAIAPGPPIAYDEKLVGQFVISGYGSFAPRSVQPAAVSADSPPSAASLTRSAAYSCCSGTLSNAGSIEPVLNVERCHAASASISVEPSPSFDVQRAIESVVSPEDLPPVVGSPYSAGDSPREGTAIRPSWT